MRMPNASKTSARKATNLSIDPQLLQQARDLQINLSATLEKALKTIIREKQQKQWLQANTEAIAAYNRQVDENGVFSDDLRSF